MADEVLQQKIDNIVEDEVRRGFTVRALPESLQKVLQEAHDSEPASTIPIFTKIRFTKLTPRKRRQINEAVVKRYHADLKDSTLLSNAELRKINISRGEWSQELEDKIKVLADQTNAKMRDLYLDGVDHRSEWAEDLTMAAGVFRMSLLTPLTDSTVRSEAEQAEINGRFDRWLAWDPAKQTQYTELYAKDQGLETYSVDRDQQWLYDRCATPEAVEAITTIQTLQQKIRRYIDVIQLRHELVELQAKQARMYAESVETRRDVSEELARVYYCTEVVDDQEVPKGPLTKTFDGLWDLPDEVVQWLQVEIYFFLNGIPEAAREYLTEWGFIRAPQSDGSSAQPEESPAEPSAKDDSPQSTATA